MNKPQRFPSTTKDRDKPQRPGTFRKGHKKFGGRKKGTPNRINSDFIEAIVQAAAEVGSDGKGKDGLDGYLRALAKKEQPRDFVSLFRQVIQRHAPTAEPEDEVVYPSEQDFRQALLDRGVHPTLLPPPPRDLNERPPVTEGLKLPKPPSGWEWELRRTGEIAEVEIHRRMLPGTTQTQKVGSRSKKRI